jgi:hypothetical protein
MIAAALGWVSTVGTLTAYILLCRGRLTSSSMRYAAMNAIGGILGGGAAILYHAWPSMASNFVWAVLGGQALVAGLWSRRQHFRPVVVPAPVPDLIEERVELELAS